MLYQGVLFEGYFLVASLLSGETTYRVEVVLGIFYIFLNGVEWRDDSISSWEPFRVQLQLIGK